MRLHQTPRRRLGATLLVTTALVLAACGDDDTLGGDAGERDEFGVALVHAGDDSGDGESIVLPPAYQVGHAATTEVEMEISFEFEFGGRSEDVGVGMRLVMTEEVTDVASDGVATVEARIDVVELTDASDVGSDALGGFDDLVGEVVVGRYSHTGAQIGPMELANGEPLPDDLAQMFESSDTMAFPSEPVSPGARWSSLDDLEIEGVTITGETFYELVELTDEHYVIELTQKIPLDERVDGARLQGEYTAEGTVTGSRQNPLMSDMDYEQDGRFTISEGSDRARMSTHIVLEMTSR